MAYDTVCNPIYLAGGSLCGMLSFIELSRVRGRRVAGTTPCWDEHQVQLQQKRHTYTLQTLDQVIK